MKQKLFPLVLLFALALGFGLGLSYAWIFSPAQYVEAEPRLLRNDFKDRFRVAIAAAYASNADLERARARLELLGDPDPSQVLVAQAQRMLASGEPPEAVQQVALLASALQGQAVADQSSPTTELTLPVTSSPTMESTTPGQTNTTATGETGTPEPTSETEATNTPLPQNSATPRPTRTPTVTLGAPYQLTGREIICEPELAEGLLQIVVTDIRRQQIPGAEIIVTWSNGEERIFTGLKPELGYGYADFLMDPEISYSLRMAEGSTPASGLTTPGCENANGNSYLGGIRLTFQRP